MSDGATKLAERLVAAAATGIVHVRATKLAAFRSELPKASRKAFDEAVTEVEVLAATAFMVSRGSFDPIALLTPDQIVEMVIKLDEAASKFAVRSKVGES